MFNSILLAHVLEPYHQGELLGADAVGQQGFRGEGAFMSVALCVQAARIREARFETYGCPAAIACGSWLMKWVEDKTVSQALALEAVELNLALGGLPLGKEHCAELTIGALRCALRELPATC